MYINKNTVPKIVLFNLGFRIFFLAAGIFSIVSIAIWFTFFFHQSTLAVNVISSTQWHAHEMIYGYSMAIIAGFLLTAIKNWTGVQTIYGKSLLLLFSLWLIARILFLPGISLIYIAGIFDILFLIFFVISASYPIIKAKQWKQVAILSKIILLGICNVLFYLGVLNRLDNGIFWGIYGGLYLIMSLVLAMSGRVMPFFIQNGVGYPVKLFNNKWVYISSLLLFFIFFISELILKNKLLSSYLALGLALVNAIRLIGWYTKGIWTRPLLWSLYISLWMIVSGFLLFSGSYFFGIPESLAIHAFTVGGIGLITMAMMSRIALGHTGRGVDHPSTAITYAFVTLILAAIVRVVIPLFNMQNYVMWVGVSQILWIISFVIFIIIYFPILSKPRVDGQFG